MKAMETRSQTDKSVTRADVCAVAAAECFRGDGEIMVSPMGLVPKLGAMLARATFEPDLVMTDGVNKIIANNVPLGSKAGEHGEVGEIRIVEGWMSFPLVFDTLWWGKRHVMMGASQIDQYGNQNIACIGDWAKPKVQLLGVRGAPGNTINHTTSYWVGNHSPKALVETVDVVSGVGYNRVATLHPASQAHHEIRRVVTNLAVLDFQTPDHRMQIVSVHPGVHVDEVVASTGFALVVPRDISVTRVPSFEELTLLRELDPKNLAAKEVKS